MILYAFLITLTILFAVNMGGSNFGASFAAACGSKILSQRKAQILFVICVFLGAVTIGQPVAETIGTGIIPKNLLAMDTVLIIFISVTVCLYIANLFHVPQSTSIVTVFSILGVGLYFKTIYVGTFFYLVFFWILFPVAGYGLTYFLGRMVYPPRKSNFWIYEKLVNHQKRLKIFVVLSSCYNAFSVGTNNVANAVGPLLGADLIGKNMGLALIAPIFGLGSFIFYGSLRTVSEKIVPLGLLTASIISLVTGTLMVIASLCGVPQSFVMISLASVFAISGVKNGHASTFNHPITRKMSITWMVMPLGALIISFVLTGIRYALFK